MPAEVDAIAQAVARAKWLDGYTLFHDTRQVRWAALGLAAFTLVAGVLYHYLPAQGLEGWDGMLQVLMFQKNVAIAGGLMVLAGLGAGQLSLDARQGRSPAFA